VTPPSLPPLLRLRRLPVRAPTIFLMNGGIPANGTASCATCLWARRRRVEYRVCYFFCSGVECVWASRYVLCRVVGVWGDFITRRWCFLLCRSNNDSKFRFLGSLPP
jgi:hypothetical protein